VLQLLTVPYLIDNPEVGYVQTRWIFANPDESYLTKVCMLVQVWELLEALCYCRQYMQVRIMTTSKQSSALSAFAAVQHCDITPNIIV